jgi:hypothetical protein
MSTSLETREFLDDIAAATDNDYTTAFKMLGFVLFVSQYGTDDLLTGSMISPRTYYRWLETVKAAGWQDLLADVRLTQALREYVNNVGSQPVELRNAVIHRLNEVLTDAT